jgi:cell volume regulation protein A
MFEYRVATGSADEGRHPDDLASEFLHAEVRCIALVRGGKLQEMQADLRMRPEDAAWFIAPESAAEPLARIFGGAALDIGRNTRFFGEFAVAPDCLAGDLAGAYGFTLRPDEAGQPLGEVLVARLGRPAVVGDRVQIGGFVLVVREMGAAGKISSVGLKCPVIGGSPDTL